MANGLDETRALAHAARIRALDGRDGVRVLAGVECDIRPDGTLDLADDCLAAGARAEERALPAKLANLEAIKAQYPALEILAYSDMSTDSTLPLLESRPDLLRVIPATERTGKAMGMRKMVAQAQGEICIFTDANVLLEPESVGRLLGYFHDPTIGGVSGTLRYINDADGTTASIGGLYWRLEEKIKALESRCGSMMGADGSIFLPASRQPIGRQSDY